MADKRRLVVLFSLLAATAVVAAYVMWPTASSVDGTSARNGPPKAIQPATALATAPDVHTEALRADRPRPGGSDRDLFKFKPKYVPPPPPVRVVAPVVVPSGPPPPPPVPPIPLKFIGLLEASPGQRMAILSDGRGAPLYGKEGDAVLGQYRILRIGAESIELDYIDGRGRQTIRLSGS